MQRIIRVYQSKILQRFKIDTFAQYLKRLVEDTPVNWEEMVDKEVTIQTSKQSKPVINLSHVSFRHYSSHHHSLNKHALTKNDSAHNFRILENVNRLRPSKIKIGDEEFYMGRIQYKPPSAITLSQSRPISIRSASTDSISENNGFGGIELRVLDYAEADPVLHEIPEEEKSNKND